MIYQTDPLLPAEFHRWGCRFMCLYTIPQIFLKRELTVKDVLADYAELVKDPLVVGDAMTCGKKEHLIIRAGFRRLKSKYTGAQIGIVSADGGYNLWAWAKDHQPAFMLFHWDTGGIDGHYTVADMQGVEIYDPHNPVQAGKYLLKKNIKRKLLYSIFIE